MIQYSHQNLIVHPPKTDDPSLITSVSPQQAGWDTIHFEVRRLTPGRAWNWSTGASELALVVLGGRLDVASDRGAWQDVGKRSSVFDGLPEALYLPPNTTFTATALTECEFAMAWVPSEQAHEPVLIRSGSIPTEIRGGGQATRQINRILPPGFPCNRLVVVEVYTPGGNWSSYPPHKHDRHIHNPDGSLLEADLDEIYYYQFDRPEGYALQRVYTGIDSPLQQKGQGFDCALIAHQHDVVLVPEGYHPVTCSVGYTAYYLNILAGSPQSLAAQDDPAFIWVKGSWGKPDPRLPLYPINPTPTGGTHE